MDLPHIVIRLMFFGLGPDATANAGLVGIRPRSVKERYMSLLAGDGVVPRNWDQMLPWNVSQSATSPER